MSSYVYSLIVFCMCVSFIHTLPTNSSSFPVISNGSLIQIDLRNYNVSDPDGESREFMYVVLPDTLVEVRVTSVPTDAATVVVQAHCFLENLTLSLDKIATADNSVEGANIGLLKPATSSASFFLRYSGELNATMMVAAQAYGNQAPVPGGCNMEFPVEISPYLKLIQNDALINLSFAAGGRSLLSPTCNANVKPVEHLVYHYYVPEHDFTPEMYFSALQSMMTRGRILQSNAWEVRPRIGLSPLRRLFASYPGTGGAFVVVVNTLTDSAVYVPAFTYGCDPNLDGSCHLTSDFAIRFALAFVFFYGLLTCFVGHRLFFNAIFILGYVVSFIIYYIIFVRAYSYSEQVALTSSLGMALPGGILLTLLWIFLGSPIMIVLLACLVIGFGISSIISYVLVDFIILLESDINFWSLFMVPIIITPIFLLSFAERANMAACSLIGAALTILPFDVYLGSNLSYIFYNVLRRATVPQFNMAATDPPIQSKDVALFSVFVILTFIGLISQKMMNRNRPPFPAPINCRNTFTGISRNSRDLTIADERTHLIIHT